MLDIDIIALVPEWGGRGLARRLRTGQTSPIRYNRRVVRTLEGESDIGWLWRRLALMLLIVLAGTLAIGLLRGMVAFVPGIFGMAAGGLTGYLCGRIGREDPEARWPPGQRLWLALGAAALYGVGTAATVSVLRTGLMGAPLEWMGDVIGGADGEFFFGTSRNSYQSVSGTIRGTWWVVFSLLDAGLFLPLFFVSSVAGFGSRSGPREIAGDEVQGAEVDAGLVSPGSPARGGAIGCGVFVITAAAVLAALHFGPGLAPAVSGAPSADDVMWGLQGEWQFEDGASWLGVTPAERTFTMSRVFDNELAGVPADPTRFMLTLERRRDGVFEGRLLVSGGDVLPVRMQPSPESQDLDFVVEWWGPGGRSERRVTAHRLPD